MAKSKLDIAAEGNAASVSNDNVNPYRDGSWQANAWTAGWQEGEDEKACAKQAIYDAAVNFKIVKTPVVAPRRKVQDAMRRMDATRTKLAHNARMRKLANANKQLNKRWVSYD